MSHDVGAWQEGAQRLLRAVASLVDRDGMLDRATVARVTASYSAVYTLGLPPLPPGPPRVLPSDVAALLAGGAPR